MARNTNNNSESLGEFYLRIGLDFDDLNNSFVQVERTLNQNLGRLNRANRVINLQAQVELQGLDESADAERIFEVRTRQLNRTLENERTRLRLLQNQLEDTARRTGATSDETQRAEIAFENARLSVARIENQLQELNEQHARGTDWTESIIAFSQKAAPVISVTREIFQAFGEINASTDNLIEKFRELQKNAYNFNLPLDKADDFARKIRLAGGELEDIGGYLRGITDALIKGETDDPEFLALQRYGETIFNATGKLKNYYEIWEAVHRAFQKAKAEGKEIEFLQMTGGESGVTDAIQALNRWDQAVKDANEIIKANIDYQQLEQADRVAKKLTEQTDEFGKALASVFQPAATGVAEMFFEVIKKGTQILIDCKNELKQIKDLPNIFSSPSDYFKTLYENEKTVSNRLFEKIKNDQNNLNKVFATSAGLDKAHADLKKRLEKQAKEKDPFQQYAIQRTKDIKDAIADLRLEIDYESDYQKAVAQATLERERALRQIVVGDAERAAIEEKYRTDIEKAEKDHADKLEDIWKETAAIQYETSHSAFEKEIYDIRQWRNSALDALGDYKDAIGDKNKWIEESAAIVANAAAKEAQAYEKEIDRIKGRTQTLAEKIFEKTHSQAERDIYRAQKEYMDLWREGIYPKEMIDLNYQLEIGDILSNIDKAYNKVPDFKLMLPDTDFFTPLNAQIDAIIDSYEELTKAEKQALNLANIPSKTPNFELPDLPVGKLNIDTSEFENFKTTLATSIEPIKISTSYFEDSLTHAATAIINFENTLTTVAEKFAKLEIATPSSATKEFNFSKMDFSKIEAITKQLADLTKTAGSIAQDAQSRQKQNSKPVQITVSPNISIDLGGAYVFDNQMKSQLTNDITNKVANAVTDAVSQATKLPLY